MRKCVNCNKYYDDNCYYCLKCNRRTESYTMKEDEIEQDLLQKSWKKREDNSILTKEDVNIKPNPKLMKSFLPTRTNADIKEQNLPKCPTCGSTNIRHISSTERGVNAVMFGFFGNKRKCQFECLNPNCRYRW